MNQYDYFKKFTKGLKFSKSSWDKFYSKGENEQQKSEAKLETNDGNDEVIAQPSAKKRKKQFDSAKLLQIKQEKICQIRNTNKIHTWGSDIPDPITSFEKLREILQSCKSLANNLQDEGYEAPTPIQMQAWPLLLAGRNVLACAPTGSGKTAGFLVPMIEYLKGPQKMGFRAVIISPTRELASQTYRECCRLCEGAGLKTYMIKNPTKASEKFGLNSTQKFDILVTTPNRLVHLINNTEGSTIDLSSVQWLIVDESDRLFEGGEKGFRDQLSSIYQSCSNPSIRRAFFSATFAHDLEKWCKLNLDNVAMVSIGARNAACENVNQKLLFCGFEDGKFLGLQSIINKGFEPPMLIFVQTKERAKDLFLKLMWNSKIEMVDYISSDRSQQERENTIKSFRDKKLWVLICTELLSRGVDFSGVSLVVNYDLPPTGISYIHRVGRTGRANKHGEAITFWTEDDRSQMRSIAVIMKESGSEVPDWMIQSKKTKRKRKDDIAPQPDRGNIASEVTSFKHLKKQQKNSQKRMKQMKTKSVKTKMESCTNAEIIT